MVRRNSAPCRIQTWDPQRTQFLLLKASFKAQWKPAVSKLRCPKLEDAYVTNIKWFVVQEYVLFREQLIICVASAPYILNVPWRALSFLHAIAVGHFCHDRLRAWERTPALCQLAQAVKTQAHAARL